MYCPKCGHKDTKVLDTRIGKSKLSIRRRRECLDCGYRFTTVEEILREGLVVIKRDGRREDFDRMKILDGLRKATEKRPIQAEQIEMMVAEMMEALDSEFDTEIPTKAIGEHIMNRLKAIDSIAFVRYASVYKDFRDINEFAKEISALKKTAR
ncbi:transcriptional regulator NrdR [Ruficoccus sp. ZRK36]|uniref:transcriptional regulator NrdR n=1 Tax=Ruficoccus sp. ZRK36 TaxID=2866311 RepID=UPI001C7319E5|nr:transcriptional regulator NrdR [Ruficoccus sp. ZRK36]QYY35623.1 transcriptional regulator NrdR [Ruficoccus sp. ZRK36]